MGGSNEFVECFCGGVVAEDGSGVVVQLVGDGVEVALVAGHFPALVPGQCAHRPVGQAWMRRVSAPDLVCFPVQGQGDDDQVAGGAFDQG